MASPLAALLPGLLLSGVQAAASKRQRQRLVVVALLGVIACAALFAAFVLFGWALFLAYGLSMTPQGAAAAAGGTLIGVIVLLGILAALAWTYWPRHSFQKDIEKLREQIEPLAREHPLASVGIAAGLGILITSLLRK
jgi:apolipoprotein N-acyltransferase